MKNISLSEQLLQTWLGTTGEKNRFRRFDLEICCNRKIYMHLKHKNDSINKEVTVVSGYLGKLFQVRLGLKSRVMKVENFL